MKTLILGDWHRDLWATAGGDPLLADQKLLDSVEAIIFAGDISNKSTPRWRHAFRDLREQFDGRVIAFPGNHDYFDCRFDREDKMADMAAEFDVEFGQCGSFKIGDTRVLTCTLWTNLLLGDGINKNEQLLINGMNDYLYIRVESGGFRKLRPSDTRAQHLKQVAWLERQLEKDEGRTVVVTHHAPHPSGLTDEADHNVSAAYASDLSSIIEKYEPDLWLHGHAHSSKATKVGNTVIENVSLGYPKECEGVDLPSKLRGFVYEF